MKSMKAHFVCAYPKTVSAFVRKLVSGADALMHRPRASGSDKWHREHLMYWGAFKSDIM